MASESKLFTTVTVDNIRDVLCPLTKAGIPFYIITAESGYCPACHSDLSSANITAPNSLLGHLRRSKKCIAKRDERNIKLFGLKQPDSLLWGSVDDLAALDVRRCADKDLWVQSVFPPNRPSMSAPMYASISQWHARTEGDGYSSASPPPSSAGSDDGWATSSASSSGGSPSSAHFNQQYILPSQAVPAYGLYDPSARRESNSTITGADYYGKTAMYNPAAYNGVPMSTAPQPQYRLPAQQAQQPMYGQPMQQMYAQPGQPPMYAPGYQYPTGPQPGYSW